MTMIDGFTIASAPAMDLDDWPVPDTSSGVEVEGAPRLRGRIVWRSDDGRRVIGVQRCDPCTIRGAHLEELAVIVEGRLTLRREGALDREAGPGDVLVYAEGTRDEWVIHEPLLKVFHLRSEHSIPF